MKLLLLEMRSRLLTGTTAALCTLLTACGGGGDNATALVSASSAAEPVLATTVGYPGEPASCSVADQRQWLNAYMADQYFWNTNLATPNAAAANQAAYFNSLLFVPTDRYSFSQDTSQFTQFFAEGTRTGFGYVIAFTDASRTRLQIRSVEPAGPAAAAGLKRGDTVLSIDGLGVASIANGEVRSVNTSGVTRTLTLENAAGSLRVLTMVSSNFALASVASDKILTAASGAKVGYLEYQEFSPSSVAALGGAFNRFRAAGISELIVDLRYNSGGSVQVARTLASLIGGAALDRQVFAKIRFNSKNAANDFDYLFTASGAALPTAPLEGLSQVVFITSPNTASASELLINALTPFKNVVTIGAATFGKPFGFQPRSACDVTYNAVNFETFNAADFGRYTSGLPATCKVPDDLSKALGDPAERRTAAALGFIQTKACPVAAIAIQKNNAAAQYLRAQAATDSIAETRWMEPAFGEVTMPGMQAD